MTKHKFNAILLESGKTATGIRVPEYIVEKLNSGKKPAVKVTINAHTYRNTIAVMGGVYILSVSADVREKAGIKGGDDLQVEIELDTEPRVVTPPADFLELLNKDLKAKLFFDSLSYSNKLRYILPFDQAKTTEIRNKRIEKAISDLSAGKK